jgi:hypothetical protein
MNKKLKSLIKLSSKVAVYVPSTLQVSETIDSSEYVKRTLEFLSSSFGGATSTKAVGCWMSKEEGLIKETVEVCYSYTDTVGLESNIEAVIEYCEMLKKEMGQEAISLEVNNELYFI